MTMCCIIIIHGLRGVKSEVEGCLQYLVFRDPCVPQPLGCPGNPRILSFPGSKCAPASRMSQYLLGIPGYLVFCVCPSHWDVPGFPGMS